MDSLKKLNPFRTKTMTEKATDSINSLNPFGTKTMTEKATDSMNLNTQSEEPLYKKAMTPPSYSMSGWLVRLFLLFLILALLGANVFAYLSKGTDLFSHKLRELVNSGGKSLFDSLDKGLDNTASGTNYGSNIVVDSIKSLLKILRNLFTFKNPVEEKKKKEEQKKKNKKGKKGKIIDKNNVNNVLKNKKNLTKNIKPDISESNIQKKKGGFCYVGHQTPHNACLMVNDVTKCLSGKIFKTMKECQTYQPNSLL